MTGRWRGHPVLGRSAWTLADQAASSSSNFVLALSMLAVGDRREFAAFSVVITGYLLVTQLTRSAFLTPVLILYSEGETRAHRRSGPAVAAGVVTASLGGVVLAAAGAGFRDGRTFLLVLAVALPLLQYQDGVRHVAFAESHPKVAAQSDLLWLGAQVIATAIAWATGHATPTTFLVAWAATGSISGLVYGLRIGLVPRLSGCRRWLGHNRRLCARLSAEFVMNFGSYYALSYGLVLVAGAEQLGRWRAAQALIGPVSVLLLGGTTLGVPESVRVGDRDSSLRRFAAMLSVGLCAVALAGGGAAYALVSTFGRDWFPDSFDTARPVLPVLTLFAAAVGASTGAIAALRARDQAGWIVRCRAVTGALGLVVGLVLAARWGANGALAGLTASESGFAVAAWLRLSRTLNVSADRPELAQPEPEHAKP